MPILMILLIVCVLAYNWHKRATTTLTRDCRWRQYKALAMWRCAYCGAETAGLDAPRDCLRQWAAGDDTA